MNVVRLERVPGRFSGTVTYHDSCSGLREMGVKSQPRALLAKVAGLSVSEMQQPEQCCGFGGTFAVKYGDISSRIADLKCEDVAVDRRRRPGAGRPRLHAQHRRPAAPPRRQQTRVLHVAEVLAGELPQD